MAVVWNDELSRTYARYMERNIPHDHRAWAERIAKDVGPLGEGATVVDVAGGPAFLLLELAPLLPGARLVVTDASAAMIELAEVRAQERGRTLDARLCPAELLDLSDGAADVVVCKHFVRLAPDLGGALREVRRVLRPSGRAYFVDFDRDAPFLASSLLRLWIHLTAPDFIRREFGATMRSGFTAPEMAAKLLDAGFSRTDVLKRGVSYLVRATR